MNKPKANGADRQEFVQTSVKLPATMRAALERRARAEDRSFSWVLRDAVRTGLAASGAPEDPEH